MIENASLDGIRAALVDKETHVFHYIGHGTVGPDGRSALALTDGDGRLSVRSLDDVAAVLGSAPSLRLVVLNSCHGSLPTPSIPLPAPARPSCGPASPPSSRCGQPSPT